MSALAENRNWLPALIDAQMDPETPRCTMMRVEGDSMAPTLSDGDYVIIDHALSRYRVDDLYALFGTGGAIMLRRVIRDWTAGPGMVQVRCDNHLYTTQTMEADRLWVHGRVAGILKRN